MNFDDLMSEKGLKDRGSVALLAARLSHVLGLPLGLMREPVLDSRRGPALFMDTGGRHLELNYDDILFLSSN